MRCMISLLTPVSRQELVPASRQDATEVGKCQRLGATMRGSTRIHISDGVQLEGGYQRTEKRCKTSSYHQFVRNTEFCGQMNCRGVRLGLLEVIPKEPDVRR